MNANAVFWSDDPRESADAATDAARRTNWANTSAPNSQPRSSKPGTPGPVATSRSRSSGFSPARLAGGCKRRMLNKRETTAVASASAARAVKDPRSCQRADINSNAIQTVVDAANQAVTGWPRRTLDPHPIMMTATATVRRLSQWTYLSIFMTLFPQDRNVLMPVSSVHPSRSVRRRRATRTLGCRTGQPGDRRRTTFYDRRCASSGEDPARNFVLSRKPHVRLRACVSEKSVETPYAIRVTRDAIMEAHDHHAATMAAFLVELIEFIAKGLLVRGGIPAHKGEGDD